MRVIVRDEPTGQYLGPEDTWVSRVTEARKFETIQSAAEEARKGEDFSVVLGYEDPGSEIAINPVFCI